MRILILIGTRPEAIKLAPVILQLRKSSTLAPIVCSTGQHKEMLESAMNEFDIHPEIELNVMTHNQSLPELMGRLLLGLGKTIRKIKPSCIIVQGDTTTVLAGALSGFYSDIPVGHVEAGLRSGDMYAPYPEEFNRKATSLATRWHFAPTKMSAQNLIHEGIEQKKILVTGNTVVDSLLYMQKIVRNKVPQLPEKIENLIKENIPYILITGHRRENFGQGMESICDAISHLATIHPEHAFVYPVHLNPRVSEVVNSRLRSFPNVFLIDPCPYKPFLRLLDNCLFIMSDSGGVQEEAPSLGKHVLVMRETTERPEGVDAGVCRLVGTDVNKIITEADILIKTTPDISQTINPYGDGRASERIVSFLEQNLHKYSQ